MKAVIYTIGYAHHTQEALLELLLTYHINCVIDVRTIPYSAFHPQFNKEIIKAYLNQRGIAYLHMQEGFGIIKHDKELLDTDGYIDFTKIAKSKAFLDSIKRVETGIKKGYVIAFMCAEKDPIHCHRSTLVGRAFDERSYEVYHILHDGSLEKHEHMEERMKTSYCPDDHQLHLFEEPMSGKERLTQAYTKCDREIFIANAKRSLKEAYDFPKKLDE